MVNIDGHFLWFHNELVARAEFFWQKNKDSQVSERRDKIENALKVSFFTLFTFSEIFH
jgi:hypothetical protein